MITNDENERVVDNQRNALKDCDNQFIVWSIW